MNAVCNNFTNECLLVTETEYSILGTLSAHLGNSGVLSVKVVSPCWWNG